jgi:pyrimidine operon attenuation protein/uracil phosphoribosyltransferase
MNPIPEAEYLYVQLRERLTSDLDRFDALVGIHSGGAWLAERLRHELAPAKAFGSIDVSFYRDDLAQRGLGRSRVRASHIPFPVQDARILLVDDVLYTGRTVRAAINELFDYGRPARVELAVLVDRGERELPICARYVAHTLPQPLPAGERLELARDEAGLFTLRTLRDEPPTTR